MAYLDSHGLETLWAKIKTTFGATLSVSTSSTAVDVALKDKASTPNTLSTVTIPTATTSSAGAMGAADKSKLDGIEAGANAYTLPPANGASLGGIKVGDNLSITADGTLSAVQGAYELPTASASTKGGIKVGANLSMNGETLSATDTTYTGTGKISVNASTHVISTTATQDAPSSTTPKMNGSASTGSETGFSRGDHVHPTDTSRAPLASPSFTGTPTAPTAAAGTSTTQVATCAFVEGEIQSAQAGAAKYKGTLSSEAQFTGLSNYKQGWYYVVDAAWTSASKGIRFDVGNMVFCNKDSASFSASDFDVIQADIDAIPDSVINALD